MYRIAKTAVALSALLLLAACQAAPPVNRGQSGYRMDPSHDAPSELRTGAPRSHDLLAATNRMARDIASRPDITDPASPPKIVIGSIENATSMPAQSYQVFLDRLRVQLQRSGARHGLEFLREREFVEDQRARVYAGDDPRATAASFRQRADYLLTCRISDMPSGATNYYFFDYQLVQLRDASSGPDLGSGSIVWENMYEVKFQ